ncbi:MAG: hypothetical protein K6G74_00160 [Bacilli bacterium]|nr:hypothetical protein [Bacilli bacterium]
MKKKRKLILLSVLPFLGGCFAIDTYRPTGPFCHFKKFDDFDNEVAFHLSEGIKLNTEFGLYNSDCESLLSKTQELEYVFLLGYGFNVAEYSCLYRIDASYSDCSYTVDKQGSFHFSQETELYLGPDVFDSKEPPIRIVFASTLIKAESQKIIYTSDEISVHVEGTFWFDVCNGIVTLKKQKG